MGEDWSGSGSNKTLPHAAVAQPGHRHRCTGARGRDSTHGGAKPNLRLSSRLDGANRDERLANTGSSDGTVADASHPDVPERAAQQTHEVAIRDASTSGQRSSGRARDDFGSARAVERFRPTRRSQPEQLRMPVQAVP